MSSRGRRSSQAQRQSQVVNEEEDEAIMGDEGREKLVDSVVRYLLTASQSEKAIKRADIVSSCFNAAQRSEFNEILEEAKENLLDIFGIQVLEPPEKKNHYYMVNALPVTGDGQSEARNDGPPNDALVFVMLSHIMMESPNEKFIPETDIIPFLRKLGVHYGDKADPPHELFGDVNKLISKTFVEQGWLAFRNENNDDGPGTSSSTSDPRRLIGWGLRAKAVLSEMDILKVVGQIMFDNPNQFLTFPWNQPYRKILKQAEERDNDDDQE